jgi:putative spermidine/putrescine transport system substrate-binding protein
VNTDLIKHYDQIEPFLKDRSWNSVNGQMYGAPHGWGANLLMWRTDDVNPAPTSWGAVFTDASK